MRALAHAKINLCLEVGPRRDDGFHELVTIFQTIALADELILDEADELTLEVQGQAPAGDENLVLRAARLLEEVTGKRTNARIRLRKRIPVGGGLGGGSSDAACVLEALDELFCLESPRATMHELACRLGSDVPYFLVGGTALGTGRGERLFPLEALEATPVVLVGGNLAVSTAEAFSALATARRGDSGSQSSAISWVEGKPVVRRDLFRNDLEGVVFARHPELEGYKRALLEEGAFHALMSGSGATVYGLFDSVTRAEGAAARLQDRGIPAEVTETVDRSTLSP